VKIGPFGVYLRNNFTVFEELRASIGDLMITCSFTWRCVMKPVKLIFATVKLIKYNTVIPILMQDKIFQLNLWNHQKIAKTKMPLDIVDDFGTYP